MQGAGLERPGGRNQIIDYARFGFGANYEKWAHVLLGKLWGEKEKWKGVIFVVVGGGKLPLLRRPGEISPLSKKKKEGNKKERKKKRGAGTDGPTFKSGQSYGERVETSLLDGWP